MYIRLAAVCRDEQIQQVAALAECIWNQHFPKIIGQQQVDYMVERFQSRAAIQRQIDEGYRYFLIQADQEEAGYTALVERPDLQSLQISKLYLLPTWRGRGMARTVLGHISDIAREDGYGKLYLTVNKYNHAAIAAYRRLGFIRAGEVVADIGNGFVMDDYEMELPLVR